MGSRRGSIDDYPEHLNPFYEGNEKHRFWKLGKVKRSGSFGESFRNSFIFKSFRGRKKDKQQASHSPPELRKNVSSTETRNRQTLPPPRLSPIYSPARSSVQIPLPRSRFSERVAKSSEAGLEDETTIEHIPHQTVNSSVTTVNPFDDKDKVAALKLRRIRRRKKRAPLPPNVTREEGDAAYLGVSSMHNLSKWSLTSVETDISTYSENESFAAEGANHEISEIMNNITKEMEKLTDETNDSSTPTKEVIEEKPLSDIPDLIVSSTEITRNEEFRNTGEEVVSVTDIAENKSYETPIDENSNIVSNTKSDDNETGLKDVESCDNKIIASCDDVSAAELECNNNTNHASSEQDLNFNERKSIYITDSNEQLDKSDSVKDITNIPEITESGNSIQNNNSAPVSPRCRTEVTVILNASDNIIEDQVDSGPKDEKTSETINSPTPKKRTHKLSKSDLLGNNTTVSA